MRLPRLRALLFAFSLSVAIAHPATAQGFDKGWVDVNFGVAAAAEKSYTSTRVLTIASEAGGGAVAYSWPRGASFDVGGGYMFTPRVGLGVSLAGTAHQDHAGLAISVPHPLYFNASATDADVTSGTLTRSEGSWHIHAMLVAAQMSRVRVRVFGGPSYFLAKQDAVTSISYDQRFGVFNTSNVVNITTYNTKENEATGWGFHARGDVSVFFNRVVGVGALVRISRGSVDLPDYGGTASRKVGGGPVRGRPAAEVLGPPKHS